MGTTFLISQDTAGKYMPSHSQQKIDVAHSITGKWVY